MPSVAFAETDMSYCENSTDAIRRLTEDYGRHRLTEVLEDANAEVELFGRHVSFSPPNRYTSLGSTASSLDYLWELHPHPLSEAGLSRHSDTSTILTEDTDSFIIGQRVWVGGTKPGTIAYIGETQFAPGEWAGIALDEAIGKNDGSVGGTKYFQCEPKKGVFSRLTRLTRVPLDLPHGGSSDTFCTTPENNNGFRHSPTSPTGSHRSILKSPTSLHASTNSLASNASHLMDYKLGDRVIIKSSQGSKVGTVRFMGLTDFANGEWVGVELDDPRGKNDGSVDGKRYFECRPNFGLFAPASKVTKSPSKVRPGACQIHSGTGIPPSGMRRANSKESMTSMASATSSVRRKLPLKSPSPIVTRPSLQDIVKEKQQQIEQLLKERDLERAEFTKAASLADDAEQKLAVLRQEFDQYRAECEIKLEEHLALLSELKSDRQDLITQLEDERRKNEDLLFKFEEAAITKTDIEAANEDNLSKIKAFEELLEAERSKVELSEKDANKLFEAEEDLMKAREEIDRLNRELEETKTDRATLQCDNSTTKDHIQSLQNDLKENALHLEEVNKIRNDLSENLTALTIERDSLKADLENNKTKSQESQDELVNKEHEATMVRRELEVLKIFSEENRVLLEKVTNEKLSQETEYTKELEKLKMELSAKCFDVETANDNLKHKTEDYEKIIRDYESLKLESQNRVTQWEQEETSRNEQNDQFTKELEDSKESLNIITKELTELQAAHTQQITQKDQQMEDISAKLTNCETECGVLRQQVIDLRKTMDESTGSLQEQMAKETALKAAHIVELESELQNKNNQINEFVSAKTKIQEDFDLKKLEVEKLQCALDSSKKQLESQLHETLKVKEEKQQFELAGGDMKRDNEQFQQRVGELEELKKRLEGEIQSLINSSGDHSSRLEQMNEDLKKRQDKLDETKKDYVQKLQSAERLQQETALQMKQLEEESQQKNNELEEKLKVSEQSIVLTKEHCEILSAEMNKLREEYSTQLAAMEGVLKEKELLVSSSTNKYQEIEIKLQEQIDKSKSYLEQIIGDYDDKLKNQAEESTKLVASYVSQLKEAQEASTNLQNQYEEKLKVLEDKKDELDNYVRTLSQDNSKEREGLSLKIDELQKLTNEKDSQINEAREKLHEKDTLQKEEIEKVKKDTQNDLNVLQNKINEMHSSIKQLEEDVGNKTRELNEANEKYELFVNQIVQNASEKEMTYIEQIKNFDNVMVEKDNHIKKFTGQIANLEENIKQLTNTASEKDGSIDSLSKELIASKENINNLEKNHLEQIEKFTVQIENLEQKIQEQSTIGTECSLKVDATNKELEFSRENLVQMEEKHADLLKLLEENRKLLEQRQEESKTFETRIVDLTSKCSVLESGLEESERRCEELDKRNISTVSQHNELSENYASLTEKLQATDKVTKELQAERNTILELLQQLKVTKQQKDYILEVVNINNAINQDLRESMKNLDDTYTDRVLASRLQESEQVLDMQEVQLEEHKQTIQTQKAELVALQKQLFNAKQQKQYTNAEDNNVDNSTNNNPKYDYQQLLEDKAFAEKQVDFLNSIIVDMQKKNEEQKTRIEILECGFSPNAAAELQLLGYNPLEKRQPPRMYCDICEEFDLHETEDCPQQMSEDMPPPPPPAEKKKKEKPPQRPYCDICEAFGHATENCEETF